MAIENFGDYTEVDPNTRITKTSTRVTWTDLDRNETAYVYRDMTEDYFDGDFTHVFTVYITSTINGSYVNCWALTNDLNSCRVIDNASGDYLAAHIIGTLTARTIGITECDGGTTYTDSYVASQETAYYLKITRDETVGTYGTLYCYIYSDPLRTTLLTTLSVTLHSSKKDFRYVHACNSDNSSATPYPESAYIENLYLYKADAGYVETFPSVATTRVTALIHRYSPGSYTLEMALGEVVADFGLPKPSMKPLVSTTKKQADREAEEVVVRAEDITPPTPAPEPRVTIGPAPPIVPAEMPPGVAPVPPMAPIPPPSRRAALTPYAKGVIKTHPTEIAILQEIAKLSRSLRAPGITEYARSVLRKRITELQGALRTIYGR